MFDIEVNSCVSGLFFLCLHVCVCGGGGGGGYLVI